MKSPGSAASAAAAAAASAASAVEEVGSGSKTIYPTRNQMRPVIFNYADSLACTYVVSVIAASVAEFATYPLDLTKTRLQIQGEASTNNKVKYRGMMATALGIVKEEGTLALWRGISAALYRHVVYSGVRICSYDLLRKKFASPSPDGKEASLPLWKSAGFGISSGVLAQGLASPADLVKVQIQMEGRRRLLGEPPRVHNPAQAFRDIVRRGGVKSLWKGSIPNMQRAALINLGDLTTYDKAKHTIMDKFNMPDNHPVHVLASIFAGFVAAILGTPADVIKTRVMNQPTDERGRGIYYKGSIDCLRQTVGKEGFGALYKGFIPIWIRLAPWSLTFWVSFEHIRRMIGASTY